MAEGKEGSGCDWPLAYRVTHIDENGVPSEDNAGTLPKVAICTVIDMASLAIITHVFKDFETADAQASEMRKGTMEVPEINETTTPGGMRRKMLVLQSLGKIITVQDMYVRPEVVKVTAPKLEDKKRIIKPTRGW